jgi:uncharacterized membrane protein
MKELTANTIIAQSGGTTGSIVVWSIGLVFLVLLLLAVIFWLRKRLSPTREAGPSGFSLADLRSLRQKGAISDDEFERAKARILQALKPGDSTGHAGEMASDRRSAPPGSPGKT